MPSNAHFSLGSHTEDEINTFQTLLSNTDLKEGIKPAGRPQSVIASVELGEAFVLKREALQSRQFKKETLKDNVRFFSF